MTPNQDTKLNVVAEKIMGWKRKDNFNPVAYFKNDYLLTGNGMLEGVNEIQNDDGIVSFTAKPDGTVQCIIALSNKRGMADGVGNDMPESFINAAYELVKP